MTDDQRSAARSTEIRPTPVIPYGYRHRVYRPRIQSPATEPTTFERFRAAHPDFIAVLKADRVYRDRQLARLEMLVGSGRRNHVRKMLRDRRLHRIFAYDAIRRSGRLSTATPDSIEELATRFNAFAPVRNEPPTLRYAEKGSGRRWVHDFGPRRRMQQALVAAILHKLHPPLPAQKLFNRGMPKAFEAIETAFRNGLTHGVEVDIVDFYGSIRPNRLAELLRPLPASCVEHVVWDVALHSETPVAVDDDATLPTPSLLMGLSLGSSTSPIVGERIVRELLAAAQLPDTITYADNLMVLGRSAKEVDESVQKIQDSARELEIGELGLRDGYSVGYDLSRPFVFLKREGIAAGSGASATITWRPAETKLNQYRMSASEHPLGVEQIDALANRVRHWRRSYRDWPEGDQQEAEYLAGLAARRFYVDSNPVNLTTAVHAVIIDALACGDRSEAVFRIPTEGDPSGQKRSLLINEIERWWARAAENAGCVSADHV